MTASRHPLLKAVTPALLLAASLLAGCGGTSPEEEPAPSVTSSCEQPFTWLDRVRMSGNRIGTGAQADWTLDCPIRSLQSARLTVCLTHADPGELQIRLTRPDGQSISLPALAAWTAPGGTCPLGAGTAWTTPLAPADLALTNYSGRWAVRIVDLFPANTSEGIFHGWSFALQGLR